MGESMLEFSIGNKIVEKSAGISPLKIFKENNITIEDQDNPLMGAARDQHMISLRHPLEKGGKLEPIYYKDRYGEQFYRRGISLILGLAVCRLYSLQELEIGHSLEHGYYYQLNDHQPVSVEELEKIENEMQIIIDENLPLEIIKQNHEEAVDTFRDRNQFDKTRLLAGWHPEEVELCRLGDFLDLAYFPVPASTGQLHNFELRPYTPGFILRFPLADNIHKIPEAIDQPKLFQVYRETKEWAKILEVDDIGSLNEVIEERNVSEFIKISEALHEKKISQIADHIHDNLSSLDLITIAGPSSSGKTTFSKRLAIHLRVNGIKPVRISTDDYFVPREETPRDEDGNYNFEALEAIDLDLFNSHLEKLLRGETIQIPEFSFEKGHRKD
ncbi:MAG: nucleoside kinase, partial [bacterium]